MCVCVCVCVCVCECERVCGVVVVGNTLFNKDIHKYTVV